MAVPQGAQYHTLSGRESGHPLLKVSSHDLNDVVGGFFGGLGVAGHVVADVILHQFGHQAVDGAADGGEALENVGARLVLIESAENAFELPGNFLGAIYEIQFFS
jgi:hypothetical protein